MYLRQKKGGCVGFRKTLSQKPFTIEDKGNEQNS
jgi:hypothetical protein